VQLVLQAVAPQTYGLQLVVTSAGQEPAPSHDAAAVAVPAAQLAPRHCTVGYAQAAPLAPSQDPPQVPLPLQAVRRPCGAPLTATHWPTCPARSQAWHCPPQAWLQQTPSAQLPLPHWFAPPQASPSAFFATQAPPASQ